MAYVDPDTDPLVSLAQDAAEHEALIARIKEEVAQEYDNLTTPVTLSSQLQAA